MLTATGLAQIEKAAAGLPMLPMMLQDPWMRLTSLRTSCNPCWRSVWRKRALSPCSGLTPAGSGSFSKQPVVRPADLKSIKMFAWAGNPDELDIYRAVGCTPVPLETVDILPNLQTGLINGVPLPPSYALAGQVDAAAPHMLDLAWAPWWAPWSSQKKTWESIPRRIAKP